MARTDQPTTRHETRKVWMRQATGRLKAMIDDKKIDLNDLAADLTAAGYQMTHEELERTIQNGSFGAWFFFLVADVLDREIFIGQKVARGR